MAAITDMPSDQTELLSNDMECGENQNSCDVETAINDEEQKSTISNSSSASVQECLKSGSLEKVCIPHSFYYVIVYTLNYS